MIKYVQMLNIERKHQTPASLSSSGGSTKAEEVHEDGCQKREGSEKSERKKGKTKKEIMMSKSYTTWARRWEEKRKKRWVGMREHIAHRLHRHAAKCTTDIRNLNEKKINEHK